MKRPRILTNQAVAASLLAVASVALTTVAGCGSGGSMGGYSASSTKGRAVVRVHWPSRAVAKSRLVPLDANSIRVSFLNGTNVVQTQLLVRPPDSNGIETMASFTDLPQGSLTVTATAFPNDDGTGTSQASAQGNYDIVAGQSTDVGLTMATTITSIALTPDVFPATTAPVLLTGRAFDASNNMVLTNQWTWSVDNTDVVNISNTDGPETTVTVVGVGTANIKATETQSGLTKTETVQVVTVPGG